MRQKDIQAVRSSDVADLAKQRDQIQKDLAVSYVNRYSKPEKNVRARKMLRQKLAVIKTAMREKELAV